MQINKMQKCNDKKNGGLNNSKHPQNFFRIKYTVHRRKRDGNISDGRTKFKFILSTWFEVLSSEILCLCIEIKKKNNETEHFHSQPTTASII